MPQFYNLLNKDQALENLHKSDGKRKTLSFYRYVNLSDPQALRDTLFREWQSLGVLGRTYLAKEGINTQISVPEEQWENFQESLYAHPEFRDVPFKIALEEPKLSFWRLTIKVRTWIVADGLEPGTYDVTQAGRHLSAEEWDRAMSEPETVVVDMRNHYESRIGRFRGALCPDVDTFREALPSVRQALQGKEKKKVLLYCTGGIRCEKASAYLRHQGFQDVNQLSGGIIQYAREAGERGLASSFLGKNFVFDDRLSERVTPDVLAHCDTCQKSCDEYLNCKNPICNVLFLQCADCRESMEGCCSVDCRTVARLPESEQKPLRAQVRHTFERFKQQMRPTITASR